MKTKADYSLPFLIILELAKTEPKEAAHYHMLESRKLKMFYLEFFKEKGHKVISNSSLIPEFDKAVLFTTAGMHPLIPYLIGQSHPLGKRLVNVQRCVRTDDIFEIADDYHLTFFEMLGNWSLGDYFKKESIGWSFEFLTGKKWLGKWPLRT